MLENRHSNAHLFQGWRQLVEIALHSLVGGGGGGGVKREGEVTVLFELTQTLLNKVVSCDHFVLSCDCHVIVR